MKIFTCIFTFLLLLTMSCRKDDPSGTINNNNTDFYAVVRSDVSMLITDEEGNLIESAIVKINNHTEYSNELGLVHFKKVGMDGKGQKVSIQKYGFYDVQKVIYPSQNKISLSIQLMKREISGFISGVNGGTIETESGARIHFEPNSIVDESGTLINDYFTVYARWLNPQAENLPQIMPGNLRALNVEEEEVQLVTYGMMAVELESDEGEKLNIASGETATLEFPVPDETLDNAPTTISLWYYDENSGFWVEEGTASLEENKYIGEVSHFSFWNCDAPFRVVDFKATIVDEYGKPLIGIQTQFKVVNSGLTASGYTDANGMISGKVPIEELLILQVIDHCSQVVAEIPMGPFSTDVVYTPDIMVNSTLSDLIVISGQLVDCQGIGVKNGSALIFIDENPIYVDVDNNGYFSKGVFFCADNYKGTIKGYDSNNEYTSDLLSFEIPQSESIYNIGAVELCTEINEYYSVTMGSYKYVYTDSFLIIQNNDTLEIRVNDLFSKDYSYFYFTEFQENEVGEFNLSNFFFAQIDYYNDTNYLDYQFSIDYNDVYKLVISKNDGPGGLLVGNIEGTFVSINNNPTGGGYYDVQGSIEFKVYLE